MSRIYVLYKPRLQQIIAADTMTSFQSSVLRISGSPSKQKIIYEDNTPKKILNKTFVQRTVGSGDAIKLLMVVLGQSRRGVWLIMLPKDKHLGYITSEAGISFYFFLTLLLGTNIFKAVITSVVNRYTISLTKLMELVQSVTAMGSFKMEVTRCKYKVQVLSDHCFCLD